MAFPIRASTNQSASRVRNRTVPYRYTRARQTEPDCATRDGLVPCRAHGEPRQGEGADYLTV